MKQKIYVVTEVDISKDSAYVPIVRGMYNSFTTAIDHAVMFLCERAAFNDIPKSKVDANALRLKDDSREIAFQFGISEVDMELAPVCKVR